MLISDFPRDDLERPCDPITKFEGRSILENPRCALAVDGTTRGLHCAMSKAVFFLKAPPGTHFRIKIGAPNVVAPHTFSDEIKRVRHGRMGIFGVLTRHDKEKIPSPYSFRTESQRCVHSAALGLAFAKARLRKYLDKTRTF